MSFDKKFAANETLHCYGFEYKGVIYPYFECKATENQSSFCCGDCLNRICCNVVRDRFEAVRACGFILNQNHDAPFKFNFPIAYLIEIIVFFFGLLAATVVIYFIIKNKYARRINVLNEVSIPTSPVNQRENHVLNTFPNPAYLPPAYDECLNDADPDPTKHDSLRTGLPKYEETKFHK